MAELLIKSLTFSGVQTAAFAALQRDGLKSGVDGSPGATDRFRAGISGIGPLIENEVTEDPETLSYLGTPVFHPITLIYGDVSLYVPDIINTVSRQKTIVYTPVQGMRGTVKEYIAAQDYRVSVQGLLVGKDGEFPEQALRDLVTICEAREPIRVVSDYLRIFGITSCVIEEESFTRLAGTENLQPFELTLVEDFNIELIEPI